MNRFQSIVDNLSASTLVELRELFPQLTTGVHWYIRDGELRAQNGKFDEAFVFEKGDPDSEAFLLLLNNLSHLVQSFGTRK